MEFYTEKQYTGDVILNSQWYYEQFHEIMTSRDLNIVESDIIEIIWQTLQTFTTINETSISIMIESLPDTTRLTSLEFLNNDVKEAKYKRTVIKFAMRLFNEVKGLGLIQYLPNGEYVFPYYLHKIVNGRIVLKYLIN